MRAIVTKEITFVFAVGVGGGGGGGVGGVGIFNCRFPSFCKFQALLLLPLKEHCKSLINFTICG